MPKKKVKGAIKETTATVTNNVDRITTTAKSINTQVLDTVNELVKDTKKNSTQVAEAATTALENIKITDSLKKISTTAVNINTEILETATEVIEDVYQSAKKTIGAIDLKVELNVAKNVAQLQKATKNTNDFMADTAETMVEDTVEAVEKWQVLLAKTLDQGTVLLGKQQEYALDTAETLIEQYRAGGIRLKKLLGINFTPDTTYFKGQADKAVTLVKEAKDKAVASVDELLDGAFDRIKGMADVQNNTTKVKKAATEATAIAEEAILEAVEIVTVPVTKTAKKAKKAKKVKGTKIANKAKKAGKKTITTAVKTAEKVVAPSITPKAKATKKAKIVTATKANKTVATTTKATPTAKAKVTTTTKASKTVTATAAKATPTTKAKATKIAKVATAKKVNKTVTATAKATPTVKGKATKKAKVATATKDDLKLVEGIGPKIEELLNNAGITTFQQLATTDAAAVKEILVAAGNRYKLHDPATWAQQAELAAAGKWEVLTVWKSRLKGGKTSNQVSRIVTL